VETATRLAPESMQKACDPITIQHLEWLCTGLDLNDPFNTSMFAMACLTFWSQMHLRELLFEFNFDPLLHITHNSILFGVTMSNRHYRKGWLPCMKTKPHLPTGCGLNMARE